MSSEKVSKPAVDPSLARHSNRLAREKSPYLLQHAHNPVDWYPWGAEAFDKAKREDKPIFLSVGYSTCYWCHVMEKESFESDEIARLINASFVPIKVDREERPDIDAIYMTAVQAIAGQGGWPMTVFLTPDGKPFWGGTYFPPEDRWGRPGLSSVLQSIENAWRTRRETLLESGQSLTEALQAGAKASEPSSLTVSLLEQAGQQTASQYDAINGGFGDAPKFPRAHALSLLLRVWSRTHDAQLLAMVEHTLDAMARGGVYDQLGGGFHRYSTDAQWLVPHFEKMLYDQALAARAYLEAFQATDHARHADVVRGIFDYVLRDLRDADGGFYSAEDAGEVGKEGEFYVWTPSQLREVLGDDAGLFMQAYGVTDSGNFEHGTSILHLPKPIDKIATDDATRRRLDAARTKLLAARSRRARPHRDDKILADWNGLMIGALAYGARALDDPAYARAAESAARFVLDNMQRDGHLLHRYRDGQADIPGFLDDYAFLSWGLLELYEATLDPQWLEQSVRLAREMVAQFWDQPAGGFLLSGRRNEALIAKTKELYDGALPSGNSVATLVLVRLAELTTDAELKQYAQRQLEVFSGLANHMPHAFPQFLIAVDEWLGPSREIVIAGDPAAAETRAMLRAVNRRFMPRSVIVLHAPGEAGRAIERLAPFTANQLPLRGLPTAYVCENHVCNLPVTDTAKLEQLLDKP